jgi:hypothetical protein
VTRSLDPLPRALAKGLVPLGDGLVPIDATRDEVAAALGVRLGGGPIIDVTTGALGWGPARTSLRFEGERLRQVTCVDPTWRSSGTSWDDFDPTIDERNFDEAVVALAARMGRPGAGARSKKRRRVWTYDRVVLELNLDPRTPMLAAWVTAR